MERFNDIEQDIEDEKLVEASLTTSLDEIDDIFAIKPIARTSAFSKALQPGQKKRKRMFMDSVELSYLQDIYPRLGSTTSFDSAVDLRTPSKSSAPSSRMTFSATKAAAIADLPPSRHNDLTARMTPVHPSSDDAPSSVHRSTAIVWALLAELRI